MFGPPPLFKKNLFILGRGDGKEKREGEKETLIGCLLYAPCPGTKPATQVCPLTWNWTSNLSLCGQCPTNWATHWSGLLFLSVYFVELLRGKSANLRQRPKLLFLSSLKDNAYEFLERAKGRVERRREVCTGFFLLLSPAGELNLQPFTSQNFAPTNQATPARAKN